MIPALRVGFRVEQGDWQEILTDELEVEVEPILTGDASLVYQAYRPRLEPLRGVPYLVALDFRWAARCSCFGFL